MGRSLSVLDASVLIALLDETDVVRAAAREAVARSQTDHELLIPITAFSMHLAADQILTLDRRWRGVDPRVRLLEP